MPIYDYTCKSCGNKQEVLVKNAEDRPSCAHCGGTDMERNSVSLFSSAAGKKSTSAGCCGSPGSCGTPGSCCGNH